MPNTRALHRNDEARHVAIIMDGNGRWATGRGMPRLAGHAKGVEVLRGVLKACPDLGVRYLTLYAFSTEHWKRSKTEVSGLMRLFRRYIRKESATLIENDVRVRFIGNRHRLDPDLQKLMGWLEEATHHKTGLHVTVAIDYGGRDEIIRATRRAMEAADRGEIAPGDLCEETLGRYMDTADLPDPDLVLRTSGEVRISNFLLWQAAYSEYEFLDICWPDFNETVLAECLARYDQRDRRFGAVAG